MSIDERVRFSKESLIEFLKRKYTPGVKFYQWHTMSSTRRCDDGTIERYYIAVGPKIAQDIVNGLKNEEISIENYVVTCGQFWADCNIYRPPSYEIRNHRRERHNTNINLRKNIRSKDKRKKTRKKARTLKCLTDEEFFNNMRKI